MFYSKSLKPLGGGRPGGATSTLSKARVPGRLCQSFGHRLPSPTSYPSASGRLCNPPSLLHSAKRATNVEASRSGLSTSTAEFNCPVSGAIAGKPNCWTLRALYCVLLFFFLNESGGQMGSWEGTVASGLELLPLGAALAYPCWPASGLLRFLPAHGKVGAQPEASAAGASSSGPLVGAPQQTSKVQFPAAARAL